ncbi:MAG: hypothetical protein ACTHJQ_20720 [Rhizobiaceae bacterium]
MKTGVEVTFDDLARMLRSLAHDLADEVEAGYRLRAAKRRFPRRRRAGCRGYAGTGEEP